MFVVFEGIDLAGKTTLIKKLQKAFESDEDLKKKFQKIIWTKEPGSPYINFCQKLNKELLDEKSKLNWKTQLLLFMANRSEHSEKLLETELKNKNTLIICDRYYMSTLVYQGEGDPKREKEIEKLQKFVTNIYPDLTFFIDIDEDVFMERYKDKNADIFDKSSRNNFNKFRDIFLYHYKKQTKAKNIILIDGRLNVEEKIALVKNKLIGR